jgi:hypothetical protein
MSFLDTVKFKVKYFYFYFVDLLGIGRNDRPATRASFSKLIIVQQFGIMFPVKQSSLQDGLCLEVGESLIIEPKFFDKDGYITTSIDGAPNWNCRFNNEDFKLTLSIDGASASFTPTAPGEYRIELLVDSDITQSEEALLGCLNILVYQNTADE